MTISVFLSSAHLRVGFFVGLAWILGACSSPDANQKELDSWSPDLKIAADLTEQEFVDSGPDSSRRHPVDEPGPFEVGYRKMTITYEAKGSNEARKIELHLWYPSEDTEGEHPTYEKFFPDEVSWLDATLAPSSRAEGYSVLVHSHGHRGFAGNSAFLMRHFASHGWLAAAPDHTGNTLSDNLDPRPLAIYYLRSTDITATLDYLGNLPKDDPLGGKVDLARVALSGHSFGVHTCWSSAGASYDQDALAARCALPAEENTCAEGDLEVFAGGVGDPRIVGIIPMAGSIDSTLFGHSGHSTVDIPILAMSGTEDEVGAEKQFARCAGLDITWIELQGGCHQTFGFGGCATLEDSEGFRLVNAYAMAFARRFVLEEEGADVTALLDGSISLSDKVLLHRQ